MEDISIFGIGASFKGVDISDYFLDNGVIGMSWSETDAPELRNFIKHIKAEDIVYIKSCNYGSGITVKGIGVIESVEILNNLQIDNDREINFVRKVKWLCKDKFIIIKKKEKNNVRSNAVYQEFHTDVVKEIRDKLEITGNKAYSAKLAQWVENAYK